MRNLLVLLLLLINVSISCSQYIYYGYPSSGKDLKKGDRIILNLPNNVDGRFEISEELNRLVEFINNNENYSFRIEINIFGGSKDHSNDYSESLCNDLKGLLKERSKGANFSVVSNGCSNPLFLNKSDFDNYMKLNRRMEILIE
jgi:hypothetical protein